MKTIPKEIPYKDRSEFLRGFLILIRQDEIVCKYERNMALVIGRYFGFDEKFCEDSIGSLLENEYISSEPAVFSNIELAEYFVEETFNILSQIHPLNEDEVGWLKKTAAINNVAFPLDIRQSPD